MAHAGFNVEEPYSGKLASFVWVMFSQQTKVSLQFVTDKLLWLVLCYF